METIDDNTSDTHQQQQHNTISTSVNITPEQHVTVGSAAVSADRQVSSAMCTSKQCYLKYTAHAWCMMLMYIVQTGTICCSHTAYLHSMCLILSLQVETVLSSAEMHSIEDIIHDINVKLHRVPHGDATTACSSVVHMGG
jgi:predicted nucleic acid-binding Zn ribbon protein